MATITINGKEFPAPDVGANLIIATYVTDGKNALGEFIGQKVGRDQYKIDNLQWKFLDAKTWESILQEFKSFLVTARIPDMASNCFIELRMYPGNRTATPIAFDDAGLPTMYQDCKVNLIDCGVIE